MSDKGINIRLTDADKVTLVDLLWSYAEDKQTTSNGGVNPSWFCHMDSEYYKGLCDAQISLDNAVRRVLNELEKDGATFDKVVHRMLKDFL